MSTLESIKNNLSIARNLLVDGRDRYLGVTRVALGIEQIYRKQRHRAKFLSQKDAHQMLLHAHQESAQKIVDLCKENGAIWVKFGQFLSCRPDVLPMEYVMAFQSLQNAAIPAPFEAIHPMIVAAWGEHWDERFQAFDIKPSAAASVAQVHRAVLKDGRRVAVKFQLPDVRELFEQDSLVFRSVAAITSPLIREFDIRQMTDQLIKMTLEELDFRREAANLNTFSERAHMNGIVVPALIAELSTEKILVTEWIDGVAMSKYLEEHEHEASGLLTRLLHSYIQQVTQFGVYHADPHPGNFMVTPSGDIAILDYGAIAYLSPDETRHYGALLLGLMGMPGLPLGELFRRAGFVCENQTVLEEISDHFIGDNRRERSVSDRLNDILERLRTNRVVMPDSFVAMARVIISVGGLMKRYNVGFEWQPGMKAN